MEKIDTEFKTIHKKLLLYGKKIEELIKAEDELGNIDNYYREEIINSANQIYNIIAERWFDWTPIWEEDYPAWKELFEDIYDCDECVLNYIRKANKRLKVPGSFDESQDCKPFMIISESPGFYEETTYWEKYKMEFGYPFIGQSGQFFINMLDMIGLDRTDTFVTNILKCGGKNKQAMELDSLNEYYQTCFTLFMRKQIMMFRPTIIWCLGNATTEMIRNLIKDLHLVHNKLEKYEEIKLFESKTLILTDKLVVIGSSHPAYIMNKRDDYWFIRKEMAVLNMIGLVLRKLKESVK